jgi:hypothetical protein
MYIEFRLPTGAGGMAAQHFNSILTRELNAWAREFGISYDKKIVKWTVQVTLRDPRNYTLFVLTWNPKSTYRRADSWFKYTIVNPMHIDETR